MLSPEAARHAAIRDLDATLSRLRDLQPSQWTRPTPCAGWSVAALAAHMAESAFGLSAQAAHAIGRRTGAAPAVVVPQPAKPDAPPEQIIAHLTHGRNQLHHVLFQMEEDDVDLAWTPDDESSPPFAGGRLLAVCAAEFGIHRFDLEDALGEQEAGVSQETILAAMEVYGRWLDAFPRRHGGVPDQPFSLHLEGETIDVTLTWDGKRWHGGPKPTIPVTHVRGDDSAVTLFMFGRIGADDHRLDVDGDLAIARSFKRWVPGP
mgnify:CR=1 FL=1